MNAIIELAQQLGEAITSSPQAGRLRAAREALETEPPTAELLKQYRAQSEMIARLERDNKPLEVQDKDRLRQLHEELVASEAFKKFTAAQVEYVDLMRQVNEALRVQLAETEG